MEKLVITTLLKEWAEVEVLQWMERHTMMLTPGLLGMIALPNPSTYESRKKINGLLGIKEVLR